MNQIVHKVKTVVFDAQVADEEMAGVWTRSVRSLDIDRVIDKALKPYANTLQWYRINRIEIDLGWIDLEQEDWLEKLYQLLEDELGQIGKKATVNQPAGFSETQRRTGMAFQTDQVSEDLIFWEWVETCLVKGYLPWQQVEQEQWQMERLWKEWQENRVETLRQLKAIIQVHPLALIRLINWIRTSNNIREVLLSTIPEERTLYPQFFEWISQWDPGWRSPDKRMEFDQWVWKAVVFYPESKKERWENFIQWILARSRPDGIHIHKTVHQQNDKNLLSFIPDSFSFIRELKEFKQLELVGNRAVKMEVSGEIQSPLEEAINHPVTREEEEEEALFISNAGICLLNGGLINQYFKKLGWVRDGEFAGERSREKAVWWLEYLAFGVRVRQEYHLALNKIICGLEPSGLLDHPRTILTRKEKEEAVNCLAEVLQYWTAIKTDKIETLRESFLQRPGRLIQTGGHWQLQVEARAYDILIEQIPWAFSIIKFPWMKKPLFTQWPTRI